MAVKLNHPMGDVAEFAVSLGEQTSAGVRHQIRYPLRAPVSFTWFNEDGKQREAKGNSRNISEGGAYVLTRNCPQLGAHIILVFRFLHMPLFASSQRLEMTGQVIRTEPLPNGKGMWGFAVASTWAVLQATDDSQDVE